MNNRFGRPGGLVRGGRTALLGMALAGMIAGCNGAQSALSHAQPLQPSAFYSPSSSVDPVPSPQVRPVAPTPVDPPSIREALTASVALPVVTASPATLPTTQPEVGESLGQYFVYGGVICVVNGRPIYADQVLGHIEKSLHGEAMQLGPLEYKAVAMEKIQQEVSNEITDELTFAAADRYLDENDRNIANAMTMKWRDDQIVAAGGSIELARKRSAAQDKDFDEEVHAQYRHNMTVIYYQKRVWPRIQISAQDMRQFYKQNLEQFTKHDKALFRLIKVSLKDKGAEKGVALLQARKVHDLAVAGQDFAALAASSQYNDDPSLRQSKGLVVGEHEMIARGSFAMEKVEQAVWLTGEGHVTDVITDGDALYIAKVEKLDRGKVRPFEDPSVQDEIESAMRRTQFASRRYLMDATMRRDAHVNGGPETMNIALDMAMQKYARWTGH